MAGKHGEVTEAVDYIRSLYAAEDEVLLSIRRRLEAHDIAIQIGSEEGKLLQVLIRMSGVKRIVELGTLGGYSTLWMARALPEDGQIITVESNPRHAEWARAAFAESEVGDRITLMEGKGEDALASLSTDGPYDMLFIDANKAGYPSYLQWAKNHIRAGGLVVADNTLRFGDISMYRDHEDNKSWQAMRVFNEVIADEEVFTSVIVPTVAGLTVGVRK